MIPAECKQTVQSDSWEIEVVLGNDNFDLRGAPESLVKAIPKPEPAYLEIIDAAMKVKLSGLQNWQSCKIPVGGKINIPLLSELLVDYEDVQILQYLQFGWPIERDPEAPLELGDINHKGATEFETHIDQYIHRELGLGTMIGPFDSIPFSDQVAISPLSTRPKRNSETRRIIMDCSWPIGASLNDGISKDWYEDRVIALKYPTIDMLAKHLVDMRSRSDEPIYLFKEDMDWVFRQLYADLKSISLLGFRWRGLYYFDLVMVMGCRIAPYICQRTTDMVRYIHNNKGFFLLNYVDDFLGAEYKSRIQESHTQLVTMLSEIGLERSPKKSVPPTQMLEFIGNLVNTDSMTLGVTLDRKKEVMYELNNWRFKDTCSRSQLESLIGKLQFMSNCTKPGRLFVSRLLGFMKTLNRGRYYTIPDEMCKDLKWWYSFLPQFWGTSVMWLTDTEDTDAELARDACLLAAGAFRQDQCFSVMFPEHILEGKPKPKITHLELWAIIIAVKVLGPELTGRIVKISTDNEAVSQIINTGRSYDAHLQKLLRELVWWLAQFQFRIKGVYLPGVANRLPDLLSRMPEGSHIKSEFDRRTGDRHLRFLQVPPQVFLLEHEW